MKNLKINIKIINLLFILIGLIFIPAVSPQKAAGFDLNSNSSVNISASIPNTYLNIDGYSSSSAKIELEGSSVYALTYSDNNGYFKFDHLLMPKNSSELCLTATDQDSRQSTPICLPPISPAKLNTTIGPVLLPPTISLDTAQVDAYSTTFTSGESIPNSTVSIHLYQTNDKAKLIKSVSAFSLPILTTQTDSSGYYSFSLPTTYSSDYRLYASTTFLENLSPKSNTLLYKLPVLFPWINVVLIFFILFIFFLLFYFILKKFHARTINQ